MQSDITKVGKKKCFEIFSDEVQLPDIVFAERYSCYVFYAGCTVMYIIFYQNGVNLLGMHTKAAMPIWAI